MAVYSSLPGPGWLADLDALDRAAISSETILVLPLGATEQHGRHLPIQTDSLIAKGICDRLIHMLDDTFDVHFLPVEKVTYSPEHMDHPGSQTLSYGEAVARWTGIGEAAARKGVRRILLLNAHGGNSPLMAIAVQELRVQVSQLAVATSWTRFVRNSGIVSDHEEMFGIHGGDLETSVMMALYPEKVQHEHTGDFPNLQEILALDFTHLRAYGPHAFGWKAADLNPTGVTGNAGAATVEKGERLLALAVDGLKELVEDMARFDLALLRDA